MRRLDWGDLDSPHAFLHSLLAVSDRYVIHPGDFSWWVHHHDPRRPRFETWMDGADALLVIDPFEPEIDLFVRPGAGSVGELVEWAQGRVEGRAKIGWVSDSDLEMNEYLSGAAYRVVETDRSYRWDLRDTMIPAPALGEDWVLRPVLGEKEAGNRRHASHLAFESTMDPAQHLDRYLTFMRSPVYLPENDLVAIAPDGTIASFMVWWPDPSGIAQIEPFGTHPDFQRRGVGKALIHHGLSRMKEAGMTVCRVVTNDYRLATHFYESVGFTDVGALRWWAR
jgi:ribosomal protein S18 acetylase RimI-like enzyme